MPTSDVAQEGKVRDYRENRIEQNRDPSSNHGLSKEHYMLNKKDTLNRDVKNINNNVKSINKNIKFQLNV